MVDYSQGNKKMGTSRRMVVASRPPCLATSSDPLEQGANGVVEGPALILEVALGLQKQVKAGRAR